MEDLPDLTEPDGLNKGKATGTEDAAVWARDWAHKERFRETRRDKQGRPR